MLYIHDMKKSIAKEIHYCLDGIIVGETQLSSRFY